MKRLSAAATAIILTISTITSPPSRVEASERPSEAALSALEEWEDQRDPSDYVRFVEARRRASERVGNATETDPLDIERAWSQSPIYAQVVVLSALAQVGKEYVYATSNPDVGFDCSGLTAFVWREAGFEIPKTSRLQFRGLNRVEEGAEQPGDILARPGHVAIWIGVENLIVHAANRKTDVTVGHANLDRYRLVRPAIPSPASSTLSRGRAQTAPSGSQRT